MCLVSIVYCENGHQDQIKDACSECKL